MTRRNSTKPQEDINKSTSSGDTDDGDNQNHSGSTGDNKDKSRNPCQSSITHVPFRSAGGRSTGSFSVQIPNSSIYQFIPRVLPPPPPTSKSLSNSPIAASNKRTKPRSFSTPSLKHLDYFALSSRSLVTKQRLKLEEEQQQAVLHSLRKGSTSAETVREIVPAISKKDDDHSTKMDKSSCSLSPSPSMSSIAQKELAIICSQENDEDTDANNSSDDIENDVNDSAITKVEEASAEKKCADEQKNRSHDVVQEEDEVEMVMEEEITVSENNEDNSDSKISFNEQEMPEPEQKEKADSILNFDEDAQICVQSENNCNNKADGEEFDDEQNPGTDTKMCDTNNIISTLDQADSNLMDDMGSNHNHEDDVHALKVEGNGNSDEDDEDDDVVVVDCDLQNLNVTQKSSLLLDEDEEEGTEKCFKSVNGKLKEIKDEGIQDDYNINGVALAEGEENGDEINSNGDNSIVDIGNDHDIQYEINYKEGQRKVEKGEDGLHEWADETITHPSTSSNNLSMVNKKDHNPEDVNSGVQAKSSGESPPLQSDYNNNIGLALNSFTNAGLEFGSGHLDTSQIQWTNNRDIQNDNDSIENEPGMGSVQSSSVVSSITNFSTAASISTLESSTSTVPTTQQLEYLTSHANLASVPPFTSLNTKKRSETIERKNAKQASKAALKVWEEVYECKSNIDAISLAINQANTLQKASVRLVDALFDYLIKFGGVSSQDILCNEQDEGNKAGDGTSDFNLQFQERKGLVLPACAIGWLASHLYSTSEDQCYFEQFKYQKEGSFLISPILPEEMKAKLQRLKKFLAAKVTRLRVTGSQWPQIPTGKKRQKKQSRDTGLHIDPDTVNAFLAYYRYLQNRPHIDMRLFPSVTYLELDGVVPEYVTNLHVIGKSLKQMTVQRGCIVDVPSFLSSQPLSSIMHLSLSNCAINELAGFSGKRTRRVFLKRKPPLASMKELVSLDVSHNELIYQETALAGLSILANLIKIDLSHNKILSMNRAHTMLGNIQELNLSGNRLSNVAGIERLYSLERLDLTHNAISILADVSGLAKLPELMVLDLKGNPIEKDGLKMSYRLKLLNLFKEARLDTSNKNLTYRDIIALLPVIDNTEVTKKELIALKNLTFSQSVVPMSEKNNNDSGQLTEPVSRDPSIRLLEPFRDDYVGPDGCLLSASMISNQGYRRTIRKSRRNRVSILDTNFTENVNSQKIKRKRKKDKKMKAHSKKHTSAYPTLVKVIHSMNKKKNHDEAAEGNKNQEFNDSEENVEKDEIKDDVVDVVDDDSAILSFVTNESNSILDQIDAALIDPIILYQKVERQPEVNTDKSCPTADTENIDINDDDKSLTALESNSESKTEDKDEPLSGLDIDPPKPAKTAKEKLMDTFNFAIAERTSTYDGPDEYANLLVSPYLELYFKSFVFPSSSQKESVNFYEDTTNVIQESQLPRIQLYQTDRDLMMWTLAQHKEKGLSAHIQDSNHEHLVAVSSEKVIPCGVAATGRIPPTETETKGIRGAILFKEGKPLLMSQCQNLLLCISNAAVYFIPDIANGSSSKNRRFPAPIPSDAKFDNALWPHSYCRHPLKFLKKITFDGFGFQRLTLYFKLPSLRGEVYMQPENGLFSTFDYTYVIFSCNQRRTIELMQTLQRGAKEASHDLSNDALKVENDDNAVLLAVSRALAPKTFNDDILHYHILTQIWQTGDMEGPRRTFILTNERIYLFHETYTGDGSECAVVGDDGTNIQNGNVMMRVVAGSRLGHITDIRVLNEDSRKVSITIKTRNRLSRTAQWLLLCKDSENAEKLVQDVRRAMN